MLQRKRGKDKTSSLSHPSTTFTIHNNNNNVLSNLITNTSRLLHSKSTYFYNGWGRIVPSVCMLALLVGLYGFINPIASHSNQAYADDGIMDDDWYDNYLSQPPAPADGSSRSSNDSNISLTITPETSGSVDTKVGETAYSNNVVNIKGDSVKSYSLSISYDTGSTNLSHSDNSNISVGNVANSGVIGDNLVVNTWGWGWSDNISTNSNTMTYKPVLAGNGSVVKSATADTISNNTVNTSGKLAFAVKFGEDMQSGHYTTNVKLTLVMEPAEVASIEYKLIYDANDVYVNNSPESALVTVPSAQTYTDTSASTSYTFTVSSSTPSDGWKGGCGQSFKGWSTSKNGSIEYSPGSQITLQSNNPITTLYAIWRQRICVG